jgi:hypothetical protein
MSRSDRDNQKRAAAQAVLHLEMCQQSLSETWKLLHNDGRPWHVLAGLTVPLADPDNPERVLTGEDVVSALLEGLEGVKSGIEAVTLGLWQLDLERLESFR